MDKNGPSSRRLCWPLCYRSRTSLLGSNVILDCGPALWVSEKDWVTETDAPLWNAHASPLPVRSGCCYGNTWRTTLHHHSLTHHWEVIYWSQIIVYLKVCVYTAQTPRSDTSSRLTNSKHLVSCAWVFLSWDLRYLPVEQRWWRGGGGSSYYVTSLSPGSPLSTYTLLVTCVHNVFTGIPLAMSQLHEDILQVQFCPVSYVLYFCSEKLNSCETYTKQTCRLYCQC